MAVVTRHRKIDKHPVNLSLNVRVGRTGATGDVDGANLLSTCHRNW